MVAPGSSGKRGGARQAGVEDSAPPSLSERGLYVSTGWEGAVIQGHPEYTRGLDLLERGTSPKLSGNELLRKFH